MLSFFNFSTNPHATDKSGACLRLKKIEKEGRISYQIQRISLMAPIDTPNGGYNYEICPHRGGSRKFCPASLSQKREALRAPFFLLFRSPFTLPRARLSAFPVSSLHLPLCSSSPFFSYAAEKTVGFLALL